MMSSGRERQPKSDPQQAIIQIGKIGFYPLNAIGLSALFYGQANCLIGEKEDSLTQGLRGQPQYMLSEESINLQGRLFSGFTDAFYRGQLPELIIVTSSLFSIPQFIEEFMDFLEKLSALGFILPETNDEVEILDKYVPQFVITAYGVVFDLLVRKIEEAIRKISGYSERQKLRLSQKFSRGVLMSGKSQVLGMETFNELSPEALTMVLSGYKSLYTIRANQLSEQKGLPCQFNPNGEMGIWETELKLAYHHCLSNIIPNISGPKKASYTPEALNAQFEGLGQSLGILPGLITNPSDETVKWAIAMPLSKFDLVLLRQLQALAERQKLDKTHQWLSDIIAEIEPHVQLREEVPRSA